MQQKNPFSLFILIGHMNIGNDHITLLTDCFPGNKRTGILHLMAVIAGKAS